MPKTALTRKRVAKHFSLPSRAKQSFKQECDINQIMKKFKKTGLITHTNTHKGNYGDFIGATDYHNSLNQIHAAQDAFATVPSEIRAKFDNDAGLFLDFVQDPENRDEMIEMGLALKDATNVATPSTQPAGTPVPEEPKEAPTDPPTPS